MDSGGVHAPQPTKMRDLVFQHSLPTVSLIINSGLVIQPLSPLDTLGLGSEDFFFLLFLVFRETSSRIINGLHTGIALGLFRSNPGARN